jgi:quercetin dioxygenase-like cupin family protein
VSSGGAVLSGEHIICTLGYQARGTGAHPHAQPSEQFNYVLQGTMMSDIAGDRAFAPRGSMLHTPAGMLRTGLACPDEDLVFLAIRDTRQAPADASAERKFAPNALPGFGSRDWLPNAFPGFGSRADEPRQTLAQILEESASLPPGPGTRYVYDMHADTDTWRGVSSAEVTADAALRLPPGIRGKLLSGEHLHVGVFRFDPGATLHNYRQHNEQLVFAVEGELEVRIDEENVSVGRRCMLHVPPGTRHELYAPEGAIVLIAQDKRGPGAPAAPA